MGTLRKQGLTPVVLVEGPSDAAVLDVLARRLGLDIPDAVVPMGGVTNVGRYLREYGTQPGTAVAGLCDRGEVRFVAGALRRLGHDDVDGAADLARWGFHVCDEDLEDELIRALGTAAVVDVVEQEGELGQLHTFRQQPFQRARSLHDQLHRFAGTKSGRKVRLAAALAEALPIDAVPAPLLAVLTAAAGVSRGPGAR